MREKDLVDKDRGASSRGQKGRGCQLDCSSDPNSSSSHREGCLTPRRLVIEAYVAETAEDRSEKLIVCLKVGGLETWSCSEDVKKLGDGK